MRGYLTHRHFVFGIISLSLILITILLGFWQLERLKEKQAYLKKINRAFSTQSLPLEHIVNNQSNLEELRFRSVWFKGHFLEDKQITISPRIHKGRPGVYTLVPVELPNKTTVLVNLGWSPDQQKFNYPNKLTHIEGIVQISEKKDGLFTLPNTQEKNQWHRIDVPEISQHLQLFTSMPFYLNISNSNQIFYENTQQHTYQKAKNILIPQTDPPHIPNNHFLYALTWFALAFCLVCAYIFYLRNNLLHPTQRKNVDSLSQ